MYGETPYSPERLNTERGTECPECGPTTWIASATGFVCCGCGQDLEALLPPLCFACGGSRFIGAGGDRIGMAWCSSCNGTGLGPDFRGLRVKLDEARKESLRKTLEKTEESE